MVKVFSTGDWADRHAALQAEVADLSRRLVEFEEAPLLPEIPGKLASQEMDHLREGVQRLSKETDWAVAAGSVEEVSRLKREVEIIKRLLSPMMPVEGALDGAYAVRSTAVSQLKRDYESIEERAEAELAVVSQHGDAGGVEAFSRMIEQIRDEMRRAGKLDVTVNVPGPSSVELALKKQIEIDLEAVSQKLGAAAAMPRLPFKVADAGLAIAASPGLAEALVIPLLQARWGGVLTPDSGGQRWLLASSSPGVAPGAVVTVAGDDPYTALIEGSADLVITDRPLDATVRARFAKAFPGQSIDSRAYSEVVALDAVALLGRPDASVSEIGIAQLGGAPWAVRETDADRIKLLTANALSIVPVPDPFLSLLAAQDARAAALFHQCRSNLRARYLPYRPAPNVPALAPSPFSIGTEDYALSFRIVAIHSPQSRSVAKKFVGYVTSDEGQNQVATAGFVDLRLHHRQETVDQLVLATLGEALGQSHITGASRYSTNLRFGFNEDELDIRAQADIGRLARALARDFPAGKLVILGFTDSTGNTGYNHALSVRRAKHIADKLQSFGIPAAAAGLGQQLPVDSNDTEQGRARNRRAEIWAVQP